MSSNLLLQIRKILGSLLRIMQARDFFGLIVSYPTSSQMRSTIKTSLRSFPIQGPLCCLTLSLLSLCSVFKVQSQLRFEVRHENSKSLLSFHVQRQSLSLVGLSGLEPPTLRLSVVRSSQLSYRPILPLPLLLFLWWR